MTSILRLFAGILRIVRRVANVPRRDPALLSHLEDVYRESIGINLAIHVGPKAIHLIALDTFDGHQWTS